MLKTIKTKLEISYHQQRRIRLLSNVTGRAKSEIASYVDDIQSDTTLLQHMQERLKKYTKYSPSKYDHYYTNKGGSTFFPVTTLYAIVKSQVPDVVVETGGTPGKSSVGILKALFENNKGTLYTCDLPPQQTSGDIDSNKIHSLRPANIDNNWIIPEKLKTRQNLILGDTKETLKPLLEKLETVDIFIHDSLHSYEHMMFEFQCAWNYIKKDGLLLSDDVRTNSSFQDFCKQINTKPMYIGNYGIIQK